jgi:putative ABC transport system permease protein
MQRRRRLDVALRLFVRGVRYRRGLAALIVGVAVIASASAAVAPIYRNAATVSALRARMLGVSPADAGVEVAGASWPGGSPDVILSQEVPRLPLSLAKIAGISVGGHSTQLEVAKGPVEYSALTWRQGDCAHVVFRSGRCPVAPNELALPVSAAQALKAKLGSHIIASDLDRPPFGNVTDINDRQVRTPPRTNGGANVKLRDTVVGLFDVPPGQSWYWFGHNIDAPIVSQDGTQVATVTALVPRHALGRLPPPIRSTVTVDQPIDWARATPASAVRLGAAVRRLEATTPRNLSVLTNIPALLRADAKDRKQLGHLVTLAQIQLLLLVGIVLVAILAASMDRRRPELVIATLQGKRPIRAAASISAEPVALLVVGVIPGVVLSVPLAMLAAHIWLRPGTPVGLTSDALIAAIAVTVVAAIITFATAYLAASRSLNDQLAEDARTAGGRGGVWIDVVAITLAIAGLVELLNGGSGSATPWSLLAPSLCGLAVGLALGRLVPAVLRPAVRATAQSSDLVQFLSIRELRRDRAAWRITAAVALALSLLTFAVTINQGAAADRTDRAGLIVGAPAVATVSPPTQGTLLDAVARADPAGRWAMAAELLEPLGSQAQRTLALDTTRLPAVSGWTRRIDGRSPAGIRALLHVPPTQAHDALPILTAGDVAGSSFALNNEPIPRFQAYQTSVLPELLNAGALTDLHSLLAVAKPVPMSSLGTTQLVFQVWLGAHAPHDALDRLRAAGLTVDTVTTRASVAKSLAGRAEIAGLSGFLAVAVIAAILAIALLVGTSVAASSRQRSEAFALTSAGVPVRVVVRGRVMAAAVRITLAALAALVCGIVTAHLSAHLIPQASAGSVPAPLLPLPIGPAVLAVLVTLVPVLVAEIWIARYAASRSGVSGLEATLR